MSWLADKASEFGWGWQMLKKSLGFLFSHPSMILPLFAIWLLCLLIVFGGIEIFPWKEANAWAAIGYIYVLAAAVSLTVLMGCSILLELLQHLEEGKPLRLGKAVFDTLVRNLPSLIPLALAWAFLQVLLWIVEAMVTDKDNRNVAVDKAFDLLHKGIRMGLFVGLPVVCWENRGPISAVSHGYKVIRKHFVSFAGAVTFSELFMMIIGLPLLALSLLPDDFQEMLLIPVLIYAGIMWTLELYLEQMLMAELFLWARHREERMARLADTREGEAEIVPSIFNGIPDLPQRVIR